MGIICDVFENIFCCKEEQFSRRQVWCIWSSLLLRSLLSLCLNAVIEGEVIICSRLVLLRAEKSDSIVVI